MQHRPGFLRGYMYQRSAHPEGRKGFYSLRLFLSSFPRALPGKYCDKAGTLIVPSILGPYGGSGNMEEEKPA